MMDAQYKLIKLLGFPNKIMNVEDIPSKTYANELIKEQIGEICGLRSQLSTANQEIRGLKCKLAGYSSMAHAIRDWAEIKKHIIDCKEISDEIDIFLKSHPTPVDEEKEQLKAEICGLREAVETLFQINCRNCNACVPGRESECCALEIKNKALSSPVPIDEEKEALKEALRLACERFVFHMKDCPAELDEDFMDIFKCNDICDQYPDKPFSCWKNYFLTQAKSKIEAVK